MDKLVIKPVAFNGESIVCQIEQQPGIGRNLNPFDRMSSFNSKTHNITIVSQCHPAFGADFDPPILYTRGTEHLKNDQTFNIPLNLMTRVLGAIEEFNAHVTKASCEGKVVEIDGKKYKLTPA